MANQEFIITFRTRAELEGAQAALAAMEKQVGAAKVAGKPYEDLAAQADKARAAIEAHTGAADAASQQAAEHAAGLKVVEEIERQLAEERQKSAEATARNTQAGESYSKVNIEIADTLAKHKVKAVEVAGAQDATAEAAKKSTSAQSGLQRVAQGLTATFPGLAQAVRMVINPFTAITALAGIAAKAVVGYFQEVDAAAEGELLSERIDRQIESVARLESQLRKSANSFAEDLRTLRDEGKNAAEAMAEYNQRLEGQIGLQNRLKDAVDELRKARINKQLADGTITKEKSIELLAGVTAEAGQRNSQQEIDAAKSKAEQSGWAVGLAQQEVKRAQAAIPDTTPIAEAERAAKIAADQAAKRKAALAKDQPSLQDKISAADESIEYWRAQPKDQQTDYTIGKLSEERAKLTEQLDKMVTIADQAGTEADTAAAKAARLREVYNQRQAKLKAAVEILKNLQDQADEDKRRAQEISKIVPQIAKTQAEAAQIETDAAKTQATTQTDKLIADAVKEKLENGTPFSPEVEKLIKARERERATRRVPPSTPGAAIAPRRTPLKTPTTGAEADAAHIRQTMIDDAAAREAEWAAQSRTNAAGVDQRSHDRTIRAEMLRDGAFDPVRQNAQMETLGAGIVRQLTENTHTTVRYFQAISTSLENQNTRLRDFEHRLRTQEMRAEVQR